MKRQITFAIILFSSLGAFAQVTQEDLEKEIKPLTQKVNSLQSENSKLKSEIGSLNSKLSIANNGIDSLRSQTQANSNAISQTANELGIKIQETGAKNEGKITKVQDSLSKKSLYGIIGVLSAILLSGLLYWLLRRRQKTDKTEFESFAYSLASESAKPSVVSPSVNKTIVLVFLAPAFLTLKSVVLPEANKTFSASSTACIEASPTAVPPS